MKIYALMLFENTIVKESAFNLDSYNYFTRSSVSEYIIFTAKHLINDCIDNHERITYEYKEFVFYICSINNIKFGITVCDNEYPQRVAFEICNNISTKDFKDFKGLIIEYQDPKNIDKLEKLKEEINKTTEVVKRTIDSVLNRGIRLDKLVEESNDLSASSKLFYKSAKNNNSCCCIM